MPNAMYVQLTESSMHSAQCTGHNKAKRIEYKFSNVRQHVSIVNASSQPFKYLRILQIANKQTNNHEHFGSNGISCKYVHLPMEINSELI